MIDRLLPPLLAVTLALPMATRGPCCCISRVAAQTVPSCCQAETTCCESSPAVSSCCQPKKPPCCLGDGETECGTLKLGRCGCSGCPSNQVTNPIQTTAEASRKLTTDEVPQATTAVASRTPIATAAFLGDRDESPSFNRPPPNRQALLCVWTI